MQANNTCMLLDEEITCSQSAKIKVWSEGSGIKNAYGLSKNERVHTYYILSIFLVYILA